MSGNGRRLIAREGIPVLLALLVLAAIVYIFLGLFYAQFIIALACVAAFIFRDPVYEVPSLPLAILSPANGRVLSVSQTEDPWLSRPSVKIRIRISPWDAHVLRGPTEAKVMNQWSATVADQEFDREYAYWLQTDEGDDVLMALGMNSAAKFTRLSIYSGGRVGQGQRCGYLYFAGIIDVFVPENSRINIKAGERVRSGADILGHFVHDEGATAVNLAAAAV